MKKIFFKLCLAAILFFPNSSAIGQRYLEEVFSDVVIDSDIVFGTNATVLYYQALGEAIPEDLKLDLYLPSGDNIQNRPLILFFHDGLFLPFPQNSKTTGKKNDENVVELCTRLAKLGYVVASCDYRLGWNPIASTQEERVYTFINATYRGVQDCRTAVRYFRKTAAENGNPYGIDPNKIAVWGIGTGGNITLAASSIDNYYDLLLPKFTTSAGVPMVLDFVNGDINGESVGVNPLNGDTLCYANHVGYSSDFNVAVNMGGACGDISWIDANDNPIISFQVPTDPFAPYYTGTIVVPGLNLPVVEVSGSYDVQMAMNAYGTNGIFELMEGYAPGQVYTDAANSTNNGFRGLFPFERPSGFEADSSPWEWWDTATNPNSANGLLFNPDMSTSKGLAYLDSIQGYAAPRLTCALDLHVNSPCNDNNPNTILDVYNSSCNCVGIPYSYGSMVSSSDTICQEVANYIISTDSAPLGMVNYSYQWYFKTGNNAGPTGTSASGWNLVAGGTSSSLTVDTFVGTRTYACFVTPDASYGISGQWMTGAKVLTYSTFAAQTIIGNTNIIPFNSYNYLAIPTPGHTFNWTVANGTIASGQGTNVTLIIWGQNGPYQVTLTESDGTCSGTSVLFAVNNNCTLAVSAASATTTSFCSGASVQLQAATTATNITYQWYLNGVAIAGETNQNITASVGGNYQVSINQNGCSAISQILSITELPGIATPTLVVDQLNAGCSGSDATVSLTDSNYNTITWSNGTVNASSINVNESGSYSVTVTDNNGCTATSSPVDVNLSLVSVVPVCLVTVDQTTGKNNVVWEPVTSDMINSYVVLKETNVANVYAQIGIVAYGSNGLFEDANSNPQVQANRYKLALIDTCGILSSNSDFHKTIHLSTNQGLGNNVNLIWSGYEGFDFGSYNIYRGASAGTMTLLTTIASNLDSYTDINPPAGDVYYMIEVEGVSCDPERTLVYSHSNILDASVGVNEYASSIVSLFPNPATTSINLQVNSELVGKDFIIYDAVGKVILKDKITSTLHTINITELASGNYIVKIEMNIIKLQISK